MASGAANRAPPSAPVDLCQIFGAYCRHPPHDRTFMRQGACPPAPVTGDPGRSRLGRSPQHVFGRLPHRPGNTAGRRASRSARAARLAGSL
jgi:hypothetical protein